jgi:class 3 adenylate cyclase
MGSMVGFGSRYNIWGEAVRVASTMSETARPGTIQVTESTYGQLQDRYLFRRRGGFFLGGTGDITTYVLRTRS